MLIRIVLFWMLGVNVSYGLDVTKYYDSALESGRMFGINSCFILGILEQEGGSVGSDTYHRNGSIDTGLAQINRNGAWMRYFSDKYQIEYDAIKDNPFISIMLVAYILREELNKTNDYIYMLSAYHVGYGKRETTQGLRYSKQVLERIIKFQKKGIKCHE